MGQPTLSIGYKIKIIFSWNLDHYNWIQIMCYLCSSSVDWNCLAFSKFIANSSKFLNFGLPLLTPYLEINIPKLHCFQRNGIIFECYLKVAIWQNCWWYLSNSLSLHFKIWFLEEGNILCARPFCLPKQSRALIMKMRTETRKMTQTSGLSFIVL